MNNLPRIATAKRVIAGFLNLMLGQKTTVVWGQPAQCHANGVIGLPHPKVGDAEEISILTRSAVHEAGHRAQTDFSPLEGLSPGVMGLMNVLEDPRIEHLQIQKFKGASLILNRGVEEILLQYEKSLDPNAPSDKARLIALNVLIKGGRSLSPYAALLAPADRVVANGDQVLGIKGVQAVDEAVGALVHCQNTADVVALARWLLLKLQSCKPEQQPESHEPPEGERDDENGESQTGQPDGDSEEASEESHESEPESSADAEAVDASISDDEAGTQTDASADTGQAATSPQDAHSENQSDSTVDAEDPDASPLGAPGNYLIDVDGGSSDSAVETDAETETEDAQTPGEAATDAAATDTGTSCDSPAGDQPNESETTSEPKVGELSDQSGSSDTAKADALTSEIPASAAKPASPKAHNQENPASQPSPQDAPGEAGGAAKGQAQGPGAPAELDFNGAEGFDLGQMLQEAYEAKYGASDVDDPSLGKEPDKTEPDEKFTQLLASSFDRSAQDDQSLEKALADLEKELAASTAGEVDASENEHDVLLGPGAGNDRGQAQALEGNSALVGVASRLVRLFTKELQDKRRRNVKLQPAGGRVASQQAWRLKALGDTRIFSTRASVCGIDAAVTILLDRSGSMSDCIVDAATAALACAQAFERISRVKTSIELFPGLTRGEVSVTLQAYGQSARQISHRVTEVDAGGGTPLAQALVDVVPKLLVQRVKKRMVLLITDGSPNDADGARKRIEEARNAGVEFLGIGIGEGGKAIQGFIPYSIVVNGVSELPDAFEALFRSNFASALTA